MAIENNGIRLNNIVEMDTTTIDMSIRKCQLEAKGSPKSFHKLDKDIEKYKGQFSLKEGDYKKPYMTGKQKTIGYELGNADGIEAIELFQDEHGILDRLLAGDRIFFKPLAS